MTTLTSYVLSEEILDKIMLLFWERGYFNTSIDDLIVTTGYNRASLYKNFGGKHGLFVAMLQRFRCRVVEDATKPLCDPANGMSGIKEFFQQFTNCDANRMATYGCFLVATASDLPMHDPEVVSIIEEFIQHLRGMFYRNLRWQQAEKLLPGEINPEVIADYLVGNLVGLVTLLRSGADLHMIQNYVQGVILFLTTLSQRKTSSQHHLHLIS